MLWDIFCRVIDNFGDVGVSWRLAAQLGEQGEAVRLWLDDPSALQWMAPGGTANVKVFTWHKERNDWPLPGDVVVETFGCNLPPLFIKNLSKRRPTPVWINLEYLSAEPYVERSHRLHSPQLSGPGSGLNKWFFYPGFTSATGGLLREQSLLEQQQSFERHKFLQRLDKSLHLEERSGQHLSERVVSLFCYDNPCLPVLIEDLATTPTVLLTAPGQATQQVQALLGPRGKYQALRVVELPFLSQTDFDRLLWSSDLNFVRGEDSFVRAQWAGRPFVWQIYPQHDNAHELKLNAFLRLFLADASSELSAPLKRLFHAWNGLSPWPTTLPSQPRWFTHCMRWRDKLWVQPDLVTQLTEFVAKAG